MSRKATLWVAAAAMTLIAQAQAGQASCTPPAFTTAERKAIPTRNIDQTVLSKAIMKETNYYRCTRGLQPLAHDARLVSAANLHARNMARLSRMSHELPVSGARNLKERFRTANVKVKRVRAENIGTEFRLVLGTQPYVVVDANNCRFKSYATGEPIRQHSYGSLARSMVKRWWGSSGHRSNMVNRSITRTGAAARFTDNGDAPCGTYYISQEFAG